MNNKLLKQYKKLSSISFRIHTLWRFQSPKIDSIRYENDLYYDYVNVNPLKLQSIPNFSAVINFKYYYMRDDND